MFAEIDKEAFWETVKSLEVKRNNGKFSVMALEREISVPRSRLQAQIDSHAIPKTEDLYKLSQLYGVTMEYLLTGRKEEEISAKVKQYARAIDTADDVTLGMLNRILGIKKGESDSDYTKTVG